MALFTHDLHVLTGVYALDALDGRELDRYERHLRRCQSCLSEVRGLREVATSLAVAASAEPPAGLRERVLLLGIGEGDAEHHRGNDRGNGGDRGQPGHPDQPRPC